MLFIDLFFLAMKYLDKLKGFIAFLATLVRTEFLLWSFWF